MNMTEILSHAGVFGWLAIFVVVLLILPVIAAGRMRNRNLQRLLPLLALVPLLLGVIGRQLKIATANQVITATQGSVSPSELAQALSASASPLLIGGVGCAVVLALVLMGSLATRRFLPESLLAVALLAGVVGHSIHTWEIMGLNAQIAESQGELVEDVAGPDLLGSSDIYASTTGPLRPDFDDAKRHLYLGLASGGLLFVGAFLAFIAQRRRDESESASRSDP